MPVFPTSPAYFVCRDDPMTTGVRSGLVAGVLAKGSALATATVGVGLATDSSGDVTLAYASVEDFAAAPKVTASTLTWGATVEATQAAGGVLTSNALQWEFDGAAAFENGFLDDPYVGITLNATTPLVAGLWSFRTTFTWTDATGQTHRSAPSFPASVTTNGAQGVLLRCKALGLTNRALFSGAVVVAQYWAAYPGESVFYLQGWDYLSTPTLLASFQMPQTFQREQQLYTTGSVGELPNEAPPAPLVQAAAQNRVFLVPAESPNTIWVSKERVDGFAAEFSSALVLRVDERGGPITGIYPMDDKTIVFKKTSIQYFTGAGPADNGTGNDLSSPIQVAGDIGCVAQASIALIPDGLMFRSSKGFQLLTRSLQVVYIGAPVDAYNSATITSASVSSSTYEVRFTTDANYILVYNYNFNAWSRQISASAPSFIDGCIANGKQWLLRSTGVTWVETPGVYAQTDPSAGNVGKTLTTGWISFGGIDGFQRVRRLMLLYAPAVGDNNVYTFNVYYDFAETPVQTVTLSAGALAGTTTGDQLTIHLERQKCSAIKVSVVETPGTAATPGISLSSLSFEVGVKRGLQKLPAAKKVGTT